MFQQWADPACPICRGVGDTLSPDKERDMRIACECVNRRRDRAFLQPIARYFQDQDPTWSHEGKAMIHPFKPAMVFGSPGNAKEHIYRTVCLWRHMTPPWTNVFSILNLDTLSAYAFGKEEAEKTLRGHHLFFPLSSILARGRMSESISTLMNLLMSPPPSWPRFTIICYTEMSRQMTANNFYAPVWDAFCGLMQVYEFGGASVASGEKTTGSEPMSPSPKEVVPGVADSDDLLETKNKERRSFAV